MDPIVDTHDEGPLESMPNAVQPTSLEADAFGTNLAPELFPDGAIEEPGAANPIPGQAAAELVQHAGIEPDRADTQPDALLNELPVPPPQFHHEGDDNGGQPQGQEDEDEDMGDDLFGDAGDDDDEDLAGGIGAAADEQPGDEPDDGLTAEERARRRALEYDEEDITGDMEHERVQMEEQQLLSANLPLANLPVPAGGKVWHARMPNFLEIRSKPFDDKEWDPKEEDLENGAEAESQGDGAQSQEVKQRMVPDENVIRWRWTKDQLGEVVKQSNARIVRWSDGTLSLQLGAELFDMTLTLDHSAVLSSSNASGLPVPPPVNSVTAGLTASSFDSSRGHGLTYLTARHAYTGSILEAHASVHGGIAFRPATIASQTHKRLAGMVAQRQAAAKGRSTMAAAMPNIDPELERQQIEKRKNEAAKKAKREAAKAAGKSGGRSGGRRAGAKKATRLEGLSDDEDDDEEDAAGDDDEGYGGYSGRRTQPRRGKGGPLAARDYSDDDDDDEGFVAKSDEEMEVSDGPQDEIEAADAAAERAQRRRKERARQEKDTQDEDEDAEGEADEGDQAAPRRRMVIESDEE
ncbi:hypothetical protein JCM10908_001927 [Rhodotorula pacifica]|uniref:RNA polymerase-associated LEO1 family protein n=1 Tax=Rhodotorula pacifica TaxID=1495444 RepID=UPI00316F4E56